MLLGYFKVLISNFSVVSTIFEVFGQKELNQHFTLCKIACVHMRKCVENMKNEIFGSNYP